MLMAAAAARPHTPASQSGPTGDTTASGAGSALNDGWTECTTCIGSSYGSAINYSSEKNRGWRLQARIVVTWSGGAGTKFPIARFISPNGDVTVSSVVQAGSGASPWTSAWTDISPSLASTIQVRAQISRTAGGVDASIHVSSSTIEFQWVNP